MRSLRALLVPALMSAALVAALFAGAPNAVLFAAPFLLVAGLLLSGRYFGEGRIHARRAALEPSRPRAASVHWSRRPERALASLLERAPQSRRGPPAPLAA